MSTLNRDELAAFLRARRARLSTRDAGLPEVGRRRTPGLRRQEVAQLAGMSIDYYIRLEQGRETNPSPPVLDALASALLLDEEERTHLHELARHPARPGQAAGRAARSQPGTSAGFSADGTIYAFGVGALVQLPG